MLNGEEARTTRSLASSASCALLVSGCVHSFTPILGRSTRDATVQSDGKTQCAQGRTTRPRTAVFPRKTREHVHTTTTFDRPVLKERWFDFSTPLPPSRDVHPKKRGKLSMDTHALIIFKYVCRKCISMYPTIKGQPCVDAAHVYCHYGTCGASPAHLDASQLARRRTCATARREGR